MVSCNGGLNQMRAAVSTVYRNLNKTVTSYISEFLPLSNFLCIKPNIHLPEILFLNFEVLSNSETSASKLHFFFTFLLRQICDMVTIARYLNVTLIVPELDKASFWADPRWYFLSIPIHFSVPFPKRIICLQFILTLPFQWFSRYIWCGLLHSITERRGANSETTASKA